MPPFVRYVAKSPSLWAPLHKYMTNGEVGSSSKSVATTAAVCRRRRRMRSAVVPSPSVLTTASGGSCGSASSCGGEGALMSSIPVFSFASTTSFSVWVGAVGGAL
eukprot:1421696-Pleurochrysis_carterae.AAC.2